MLEKIINKIRGLFENLDPITLTLSGTILVIILTIFQDELENISIWAKLIAVLIYAVVFPKILNATGLSYWILKKLTKRREH